MTICDKCKNKGTNNCDGNIQWKSYGTVYDHTIEVLKNLPENASFELQMSALFHDVGKNQKTQDNVDGKCRFIHHEFVGAKLTKNRLTKLKLSKNEINYISFLIEHHMDIHKLEDVSDKSIRRFIRNVNDKISDLFILVNADGAGTLYYDNIKKCIKSISPFTELLTRVLKIQNELKEASIKPFKYFNGYEIMEYFNIDKPSNQVGKLMQIQNDIIDEFGTNLNKENVINLIKERFNKEV